MLYWTTFILIFLSLTYSQEECRVKSVENNRGEKKKILKNSFPEIFHLFLSFALTPSPFITKNYKIEHMCQAARVI